jgi:hypothetical protein
MDRPTLLTLLAAAEKRLAQTEAQILRHLGAMTAAEGEDDSDARQRLEALQQQRIEHLLDVERLRDEVASASTGRDGE